VSGLGLRVILRSLDQLAGVATKTAAAKTPTPARAHAAARTRNAPADEIDHAPPGYSTRGLLDGQVTGE